MTLIAFALEHEAALFRPHLRNLPEVRMLIVGMGPVAAKKTLQDYIDKNPAPTLLINAGYAGALIPEFTVGDVRVAANFNTLPVPPGWLSAPLHSAPAVIGTRHERELLHQVSQAHMVDMETGALAEIAATKGIPFFPFRVISDTIDDVIPYGALAAAYDMDRQRTTPLRMAWHLLRHPHEISPVKHVLGCFGKARQQLTSSLLEALPFLHGPSGKPA
jgi:adenosylhomocysteine nucleosidase